MPWRKVDAESHRIMPWKNGGGSTAEIAIGPSTATVGSAFDWRLSIATITRDGPFSAFPGYDRFITLLAGKGMVLTFDGTDRQRLERPFEPLRFAGERRTDCRLIDGVCEDLNLIVARDRIASEIAVLTPPRATGRLWRVGQAGGTRLLFMLRGRAAATGDAAQGLALNPRDTMIAEGAGAVPDFDPSEDAVALYAVLNPLRRGRQAAVR
jgi:hypothetical protein